MILKFKKPCAKSVCDEVCKKFTMDVGRIWVKNCFSDICQYLRCTLSWFSAIWIIKLFFSDSGYFYGCKSSGDGKYFSQRFDQVSWVS